MTPQDLLQGLATRRSGSPTPGTYDGHRHSPLTQITPANVHQLTQWTFQTGVLGGDADRDRRRDLHHRVQQQRLGDRRAIGAADLAVSARSARPDDSLLRSVNRGFGVLGDRLFMTTIDAHLGLLGDDRRVIYDVELKTTSWVTPRRWLR